MALEATMLVLDNSEWMRNGDYTPTRLEAQNDAVNLIFSAKTQANPENTVGLMTMAGKMPEVKVTPTSDLGKILAAIHEVQVAGRTSFSTGIQIAQLALKHRMNKNQRQRIIVFVGSPVKDEEKDLVKLAKKLKKNNVAVDIVNFGEEMANTAKLEAFVEAVNSNDNSDTLISSAIIAGENAGTAGGFAGSSGGAGFEFGVDPNLDPELALALRISLEEERARQQQGSGEKKEPEPMQTDAPGEDAMSSQDGDVAMSEDDELARAIQMSMDGSGQANADQSFMNSVLGGLPGVDPNDPRFKDAMKSPEKKDSGSKSDGKKK